MAGILGTGIQDGLLLKPVHYQWAMDLYDQAVANTWFPNEIQLGQDLSDWKKMTDEEKHALTYLMSYFNPNELLVNRHWPSVSTHMSTRPSATCTWLSRCGKKPTTA
jgi:ribonucleoside-diphosphate reductase beta chain